LPAKFSLTGPSSCSSPSLAVSPFPLRALPLLLQRCHPHGAGHRTGTARRLAGGLQPPESRNAPASPRPSVTSTPLTKTRRAVGATTFGRSGSGASSLAPARHGLVQRPRGRAAAVPGRGRARGTRLRGCGESTTQSRVGHGLRRAGDSDARRARDAASRRL
jgi:hypothetical protein